MRQLLLTSILACVCAVFIHAQVPQLISYQAVARDLTGKVLSEKPISVQVEILQGSNQSTAVYTETHELTTTKTGTINLLIGGGNAQAGTFAEIDWSKSPYFLRLSMKQKKETEYTEVSNTQMVSVPYALYAEKAGSVEKNVDDDSIRTSDYTLLPVDGGDKTRELYTALAGGTLSVFCPLVTDENTGQSYYSPYFHFEFSLAYLTGTDLKLTAEMEGEYWRLDDFYSSVSSPKGRHYSFILDELPLSVKESNLLSASLTIKDKNGKVVDVYPFKIQLDIK